MQKNSNETTIQNPMGASALGSLNWKLDSQNNEDTQKKKQQNERDIEQITISTHYLKNRISTRFTSDLTVKKTQSFLIDDISFKVDALFKKFNLGQNNIDYMNDYLKRLNDRVNQEIKKKQQKYPSSIKIEDFKNFQQIAQDYYKNREIFNSFPKTEKITLLRQKDKLNEILTTPHRTEKLVSNEIQLNQYNEVIFDKLFVEKQLYQVLLEFNNNNENSLIYEKLFRTLEVFETNHKVEMKLLADQFRNITTKMSALQKCENIIRNTVGHLENDMLKQVGHLDLQNLNRKFKELYLPYLQDVELNQIGQFFPSGILFILMRCGKGNEAQKLLTNLLHKDGKQYDQFESFFEIQKQEKIDQNDVETQSREMHGDILLQQCYLLLLDVSEAYDIFEERKFPTDKDLYIWLTLKTTHSSSEFVDYERNEYESKKNFFHWNLVDFHESIPQSSVNLRMNIILQRYDYVLNELYKQNSQCIVQVEYFILNIVISALNIKSFNNERQSQYIVEGLVNSTSVKYPLIACLLLRVHSYDEDQIANLLAKGNHLTKVLTDKTVQSNLETIFGQEALLNITNQMVNVYFKNNLHSSLKEFQQQLEKGATIYQLNDYHTKLILKLDEMSIYLKHLHQKQDEELKDASLYLYFEAQLVQIFSWVIINQYCTIKLGMLYEKKISARQLENLHSAMKSTAKNNKLYALVHRFQLIEIFQLAQSSMRLERVTLNEINLMLSQINIVELTKSLIEERQVELIKMVFWQIFQLIDQRKCQDKAQVIEQVKEMNLILLRYPESSGLRICDQEVQMTSGVVDILNIYTKILKMY